MEPISDPGGLDFPASRGLIAAGILGVRNSWGTPGQR